mgnify:CR=1 FL=1
MPDPLIPNPGTPDEKNPGPPAEGEGLPVNADIDASPIPPMDEVPGMQPGVLDLSQAGTYEPNGTPEKGVANADFDRAPKTTDDPSLLRSESHMTSPVAAESEGEPPPTAAAEGVSDTRQAAGEPPAPDAVQMASATMPPGVTQAPQTLVPDEQGSADAAAENLPLSATATPAPTSEAVSAANPLPTEAQALEAMATAQSDEAGSASGTLFTEVSPVPTSGAQSQTVSAPSDAMPAAPPSETIADSPDVTTPPRTQATTAEEVSEQTATLPSLAADAVPTESAPLPSASVMDASETDAEDNLAVARSEQPAPEDRTMQTDAMPVTPSTVPSPTPEPQAVAADEPPGEPAEEESPLQLAGMAIDPNNPFSGVMTDSLSADDGGSTHTNPIMQGMKPEVHHEHAEHPAVLEDTDATMTGGETAEAAQPSEAEASPQPDHPHESASDSLYRPLGSTPAAPETPGSAATQPGSAESDSPPTENAAAKEATAPVIDPRVKELFEQGDTALSQAPDPDAKDGFTLEQEAKNAVKQQKAENEKKRFSRFNKMLEMGTALAMCSFLLATTLFVGGSALESRAVSFHDTIDASGQTQIKIASGEEYYIRGEHPLFAGEEIRIADGSAVIRFEEGSQVRLRNDTERDADPFSPGAENPA